MANIKIRDAQNNWVELYQVSTLPVLTVNNLSPDSSGNVDIVIPPGTTEWGDITGTLSDQTDLKNALDSKANTTDLPTKTSDLTNDSGFINNTVNNLTNYYLKTDTYTKTEVNNLIGQIDQFKIEVVQTLPVSDIDPHTIYLVPKTGSTGDVYDEYIYVNNSWELIGSTSVDLSNYYTKSETNTLLNAKADTSSLSAVATSGDYSDLINTPTIPDELADLAQDSTHRVVTDTEKTTWNDKQDELVSGTNIKTINNQSILGSGDISIAGAGVQNSYSNSVDEAYSCNYINTLLNSIFPVGKVEVFYDNLDHSNYLGFTWQRTSIGRVPVGIDSNDSDFSVIGKKAGAKTINLSHSHTVNNHTHGFNYSHYHGVGSAWVPINHNNGALRGVEINVSGYNDTYRATASGSSETVWQSQGCPVYGTTDWGGGDSTTGGSSPGTDSQLSSSQSILQSYEVMAFWKRVS